uniref:Uncharacterized protein n=1 Tax=Vombatus ursinus TaxID=29139 RepID=A0A4X2JPJ3_VOMUR
VVLLAKHRLKGLLADKQIKTGPFLDVMAHLPPFFDCFGSPAFILIKVDINLTIPFPLCLRISGLDGLHRSL